MDKTLKKADVSGLSSEKLVRISDRLILYAKGLELPPESGLELVLETLRLLRESGRAPEMETAMDEFRRLLHERRLSPEGSGEFGPDFCAPPLNRRPMLPEEMELSMFKCFLRLGRLALGRR